MTDPKRLIALSIHFDSLAECLKLCGIKVDRLSFMDPCFFAIMDRFQKIADEYNVYFSIYVIGKDLMVGRYSEQVKKWDKMGHEIGNHSWSHDQSFSNMSLEKIRAEVEQAHNIIKKVTGRPPKGFSAPAWGSSSALIQILQDLSYNYDASLIPSWMQILALAKVRMSYGNSDHHAKIPLLRNDFPGLLYGSRQPYLATPQRPWQPNKKGLPVLPVPTGPFRVSMWHTLAFMFPQKAFDWLLTQSLENSRAFYYVMHPLDLLDPATDLVGMPEAVSTIERINVSIEKKEALLRHSLDILKEKGKFVKMEELAQNMFDGGHFFETIDS